MQTFETTSQVSYMKDLIMLSTTNPSSVKQWSQRLKMRDQQAVFVKTFPLHIVHHTEYHPLSHIQSDSTVTSSILH